jgi:DmsE family decaheme c-type cytochrome
MPKRPYRLASVCALVLLAAAYGLTARASGQPPASAPADKDAACKNCHGEMAGLVQSRHGNRTDSRTPGCRDCHGQSTGHLADPTTSPDVVFAAKSAHVSPVNTRNAACLACHEARVLPRAEWMGSRHQRQGLACTNCHTGHSADQKVLDKRTQAEVCFACHKEQRAQIRRISRHPLAVNGVDSPPKMTCSDCHDPHGSTGPTLLVKNTVNETCYTCHAEKRGPFLWEHAPVVDGCINCHTPHGSTNPSLLKTRVPWLCQSCHSGDHAAQVNSGANLGAGNVTTVNGTQLPGAAAPRTQMGARACLNCHVLVHGSNHPAGSKFQR